MEDLALALYPALVTLPLYLKELREAVEALAIPDRDDTALLSVLLDLTRAVDRLSAAEALEAVQPASLDTERWDSLLEEIRALAKKAGGNKIAGVSVGFPDDFKQQLLDVVNAAAVGETASVAGAPLLATGASTTIYTPSTGKALRLRWLHLATSEVASEVVATVKLGTTVLYRLPLGGPGVFAHSSVRTGAVGEALAVELDVPASQVYVNVDLQEFTP